MKLIDNMSEFLTIENIKFEIMRAAYGNPNSILAKLDARVLIIWYVIFSTIPWFMNKTPVLLTMFFATGLFAYFCRVSPLIVGILAIGFVSQNITVSILAIIIGGNLQAFTALFIVSLKLLIISLATICIFTSMDPEKLSDALLKFGLPAKFGFGISYGYRMIPILIDEYNGIFNSFRLRGQKPQQKKIFGLNIVMYYLKILMKAFYPMMLNTAKRIRSTVEALETKGFTESVTNPKAKQLKLAYMKVGKHDYAFIVISFILVSSTIYIGALF